VIAVVEGVPVAADVRAIGVNGPAPEDRTDDAQRLAGRRRRMRRVRGTKSIQPENSVDARLSSMPNSNCG